MMARTGRRPGNQHTREAILAAARDAFAERGFDRTSIRAIATSAGVDPALVHHYFGTKDDLFLATIQAPLDPATLIPHVIEGGIEEVPERLVETFLAIWDHPVTGSAALALVRSSLQHDWSAKLLRELLATRILRRALSSLPIAPAEVPMRGALIASQMAGLAMMRYLLKLEPLASADHKTVLAAVAPNIRRYLREPLPLPE